MSPSTSTCSRQRFGEGRARLQKYPHVFGRSGSDRRVGIDRRGTFSGDITVGPELIGGHVDFRQLAARCTAIRRCSCTRPAGAASPPTSAPATTSTTPRPSAAMSGLSDAAVLRCGVQRCCGAGVEVLAAQHQLTHTQAPDAPVPVSTQHLPWHRSTPARSPAPQHLLHPSTQHSHASPTFAAVSDATRCRSSSTARLGRLQPAGASFFPRKCPRARADARRDDRLTADRHA